MALGWFGFTIAQRPVFLIIGLMFGTLGGITAQSYLREKRYLPAGSSGSAYSTAEPRSEENAKSVPPEKGIVLPPRSLPFTMAVFLGLLGFVWGNRPAFALLSMILGGGLVLLSYVDLASYRLPNRITYPLLLVCAIGVIVVGLVESSPAAIGRAFLAGLALVAVYFLQAFISAGQGMGLGDVKLSGSIGLVLGYLSWTHLILGTIAAYTLALIIGVGLILTRKITLKSFIPFGPFMALGAIIVLAVPAFA